MATALGRGYAAAAVGSTATVGVVGWRSLRFSYQSLPGTSSKVRLHATSKSIKARRDGDENGEDEAGAADIEKGIDVDVGVGEACPHPPQPLPALLSPQSRQALRLEARRPPVPEEG